MLKFLVLTLTAMANAIQLKGKKSVNSTQWGYEPTNGPMKWATISPNFATCDTGKLQSPVNFLGNPYEAFNPYVSRSLTWTANTTMNLSSDRLSFGFENSAFSSYSLEGKVYSLAQFHIHIQSEHSVGGQFEDMEIHFVHKTAKGELAVIGIFLNEGNVTTTGSKFWDSIVSPIQKKTLDKVANIEGMDELGQWILNQPFYRYAGSLTIPPCIEGVDWVVVGTPITLAKSLFKLLKKKLPESNARPPQRDISNSLLMPSIESSALRSMPTSLLSLVIFVYAILK